MKKAIRESENTFKLFMKLEAPKRRGNKSPEQANSAKYEYQILWTIDLKERERENVG